MAFVYLPKGISGQCLGCFASLLTGDAPPLVSLVAGLSEAVTIHQENGPQCDGC